MPIHTLVHVISFIDFNDVSIEPNIRQLIDRAFAQREDDATYDTLLQLIQSRNSLKRHIGLEHIAQFNRKEAIPHLLHIIHKRKFDWFDKRQAIWALKDIQDDRIYETLLKLQRTKAGRAYNYQFIIDAVMENYQAKFLHS